MNVDRDWKVFLGPILLLAISYLMYFIRYPMWQVFQSVEPIFALSFLSYFIVFVVAIFLLKKDSKKSLSNVFRNKGNSTILLGMVFAVLYFAFWYMASFVLGSQFELISFPNLRGYESYTVYSIPFAFALYLTFAIFGAFAEEVVYRGYVQTRITLRYGYVVGIIISSLFFSLQHIHVFQISWLIQFFQTQFFHVFLFGVFSGYLFFKSRENIWSVFSMHAPANAFSISVPVVVTHTFQYAYYIAEITSFFVLILILHYLVVAAN